jgi:hypothetical protein
VSRIEGTFLYELPGLGLWVAAATLGSRFEGEFRGCEVGLVVPSRADDFGLDRSDQSAFGTQSVFHENELEAQEVTIVRVTVARAARFGSGDFAGGGGPQRDALDLATELERTARDFLTAVIQQVRTQLGQHWLGTSSEMPERTWLSDLVDLETGDRLPFGPGVVLRAIGREIEHGVTPDGLSLQVERACRGNETPLPEELLNDAKYLAWIRDPPDLRLAVLLGAIACEAKIKQLLPSVASADATELLEMVLNNPRDVTIAVVTHLDKTSKAVAGRSLREEDADLYKAVVRLFETRNKIAHGKGVQPGEEEMRAGIRAAAQAFGWIDGLGDGGAVR